MSKLRLLAVHCPDSSSSFQFLCYHRFLCPLLASEPHPGNQCSRGGQTPRAHNEVRIPPGAGRGSALTCHSHDASGSDWSHDSQCPRSGSWYRQAEHLRRRNPNCPHCRTWTWTFCSLTNMLTRKSSSPCIIWVCVVLATT